MPIKIPEREYRSFGTYELDADKMIVRGTPVVFDTLTCLYEFNGVKFYEQVARDAFEGADMRDFIFNVNHESTPYARTKNGSLKFTMGERFEIEATLDDTDQRHIQLYGDIKSGRIDQMSFAFTVKEDFYDEETRTRTIKKIKKLYDVSAVTFPAYQQTSISARGFFEKEFQKEIQKLEERRRQMLRIKTLI